MKIEIGKSVERPLLTATFRQKTIKELTQRDGFTELYGRLTQCPDIRIEREARAEKFTLLAKKIGRRPASSHEAILKQFVRLLEWGSIAQRKIRQIDDVYRLNDIESVPALNGSLRIESGLNWPTKKDKIMSELATTAMQSFGEQLRYGSYRHKEVYDREVYVGMDRISPRDEDDPDMKLLTIHTATGLKGNVRVNSEMRDNGPWVEVGGNYIRSHKEQLIHLVGAVAVARADSLE